MIQVAVFVQARAGLSTPPLRLLGLANRSNALVEPGFVWGTPKASRGRL